MCSGAICAYSLPLLKSYYLWSERDKKYPCYIGMLESTFQISYLLRKKPQRDKQHSQDIQVNRILMYYHCIYWNFEVNMHKVGDWHRILCMFRPKYWHRILCMFRPKYMFTFSWCVTWSVLTWSVNIFNVNFLVFFFFKKSPPSSNKHRMVYSSFSF